MTKKIYRETLKKCPRSLHFPLLKIRSHKIRSTFYAENTLRKLLCKPKYQIATDDKNKNKISYLLPEDWLK